MVVLANTADLTESQLHALMEVIKAIVAAAVTIWILIRRKRKDKKRQKQIDRIENQTRPRVDSIPPLKDQ